LYQREAFTRNTNQPPHQVPPGTIAITEVYFHTNDSPGLPSRLIAHLTATGARCLSALTPRDWGNKAAYFTDLEDNELVNHLPVGSKGTAVAQVNSSAWPGSNT
jgi:hypothetical protein